MPPKSSRIAARVAAAAATRHAADDEEMMEEDATLKQQHENTRAAESTHAAAASSSSSSSSSSGNSRSRKHKFVSSSSANAAASSSTSASYSYDHDPTSEELRQEPLADAIDPKEFPFLWACATGDITNVRRMLAAEKSLFAKRHSSSKSSPSPSSDTEEFIEETYVQQADSHGWTAMHWAAAYDHVEILQLLYDSFVASLPHSPKSSDAKVLLSPKATNEFLPPIWLFLNRTSVCLDTPLHIAAYNCHIRAMSFLVSHGADLRFSRNMEGNSSQLGQTPLMCCVEKKRTGMGEKSAIFRQTKACRWIIQQIRRLEREEWIMENGRPDIALQEEDQKAMKVTHPKFVPTYLSANEVLKEHQMKTAAPPSSSSSSFALDASTSPEKLKLGSLMKDEPMQDGDIETKQEFPLFSPPSSSSAYVDFAFLPLLSSVNDRRESGSSALMMASFGGNYDVVLELLQNGAAVDMELFDARGKRINDSALLNAVDEGQLEIARLLLEWGANRFARNLHDETVVNVVCSAQPQGHYRQEVKRLGLLQLLFFEGVLSTSAVGLREYLLESRDCFGCNPLIWSVRRGCLKVTKYLIELGANTQVKDPATNETIWTILLKRVEKGRASKAASMTPASSAQKRWDRVHIEMCAMVQWMSERDSRNANDLSDELRDYLAQVVTAEAAEEFAITASTNSTPRHSGTNHAASSSSATTTPRHLNTVAAVTSSQSTATPTIASGRKRKPSIKQEEVEFALAMDVAAAAEEAEQASSSSKQKSKKMKLEPKVKVKAETLTPPKASGRPKRSTPSGTKTMSIVLPNPIHATRRSTFLARPSTTATAPARFFQGGRELHPTIAANRMQRAKEKRENELKAKAETKLKKKQKGKQKAEAENDDEVMIIDGPATSGTTATADTSSSNPRDPSPHPSVSDDDVANNMYDMDTSASPPPIPEPRMPLMGSISSKLKAAQSIRDAADDTTLSTAEEMLGSDITLERGLNGELNHESQVDDRMFDDDSDNSLQPLAPSSSTLLDASNANEHDASAAYRDHLTIPSLLKYNRGTSSDSNSQHPHLHDERVDHFSSSLSANLNRREKSPMLHSMAMSTLNEPNPLSAADLLHVAGEDANVVFGIVVTNEAASSSSSSSATTELPQNDAYTDVRRRLTEMGLSSYIPAFVTGEMEFSAWSHLTDPANEDMLKELIPPAGPRMKFRTWVRENCK